MTIVDDRRVNSNRVPRLELQIRVITLRKSKGSFKPEQGKSPSNWSGRNFTLGKCLSSPRKPQRVYGLITYRTATSLGCG